MVAEEKESIVIMAGKHGRGKIWLAVNVELNSHICNDKKQDKREN